MGESGKGWSGLRQALSQISRWFCKFTSLFSRRLDTSYGVSGTLSTSLLVWWWIGGHHVDILPCFGFSSCPLSGRVVTKPIAHLLREGHTSQTDDALSRPINGAFDSRFRRRITEAYRLPHLSGNGRSPFGVYYLSGARRYSPHIYLPE